MSFDIDKLRIGVIGLGYVGLPLAVEFGKQYSTTGFDVNDARIAELRDGIDSTLEVSGGELASVKQLELMRYIEVIEECLGMTAEKNMLPLQPGDVPDTYADASDLANDVGYRPDTSIEVGISNFIDWYLDYYKPDHKLRA